MEGFLVRLISNPNVYAVVIHPTTVELVVFGISMILMQ